MAGFNFAAGASNNMIDARERGMVNVGDWARRHGCSAAAAVDVMAPTEAHHTGTGHRGKSRLTPVIAGDLEPTPEQIAAMKKFDADRKAGALPQTRGLYMAWGTAYDGPYGRKRFFPAVGLFQGDAVKAKKLREFEALPADAAWALAQTWAGKDLRDYRKAVASLAIAP